MAAQVANAMILPGSGFGLYACTHQILPTSPLSQAGMSSRGRLITGAFVVTLSGRVGLNPPAL